MTQAGSLPLPGSAAAAAVVIIREVNKLEDE
ncbi:hypothetical protein SPSPH_030390 [Sporomusa sphaeroides DSM 2875]|uniref:Uncharacterized protein n=1 Tax=Sporomusa sphaeroides DSM 2875 TaxID=1337886 RepID=A0ABM9W2X4_9FIRM|nr:hypothetical protein SPSPH_38100 [Sporomusa sphaeroides DSM 2875]CVK19519.1 hypothetical protein SSPH_02170 [Sporomusa sphaeroides DSM 2875]